MVTVESASPPAGGPATVPAAFAAAVAAVRAARVRPDVVVEDVPAPRRVAPFGLALDGRIDVEAVARRTSPRRPTLVAAPPAGPGGPAGGPRRIPSGATSGFASGTASGAAPVAAGTASEGPDVEGASGLADAGGRFVLLHDPAAPEEWSGDQRVIALVKAVVEPELVDDPLLPDVVWAWLVEELDAAGALRTELGGTVTQVSSHSFGALEGRSETVQVELRASWTPLGGVGPHVEAWAEALCRVAGVPPVAPGVVALPLRR